MTKSESELARLCHCKTCLLLKRKVCFLTHTEVFAVKNACCEEIDIKSLIAVVSIDEVAVLAMVLHTGTNTAPHALVHLRIDAIRLRTESREVDITSCLRVLSGKDVVPHSLLVEVDVLGIVRIVEHEFGEFEHIV